MIFWENAFMQFSLVFQGVGGMVLNKDRPFFQGCSENGDAHHGSDWLNCPYLE